jgi:hypothetical protein
MKEETCLKVVRYRDPDGNPTCAMDFDKGLICQFYQTERFGVSETCVFAPLRGRYRDRLERRDEGKGFLIPLKECPVWRAEEDVL